MLSLRAPCANTACRDQRIDTTPIADRGETVPSGSSPQREFGLDLMDGQSERAGGEQSPPQRPRGILPEQQQAHQGLSGIRRQVAQ